jgi:ubiquinone/menaquinone biosynthesis C-methylase UbiE
VNATSSHAYVMGRSDRERKRLAIQAAVQNPITEQLFRRAGVSPGMRVLDLGCGVGDVAYIAARMVGPRGHVTAIDIDAATLEIAQSRAEEEGLSNITFVHASVDAYTAGKPFDATVGRHILLHVPDPLKMIRSAFAVLHTGGVCVFQEYDFTAPPPAYPPWPARDSIYRILNAFFTQAANGDIGSRLYSLFVEAGVPPLDCRAEFPVSGGPDSLFYEWLAESVRTILPGAQRLGILQSADLDLDTLPQRMRQEAVSLRASIAGVPMFSCFARKP